MTTPLHHAALRAGGGGGVPGTVGGPRPGGFHRSRERQRRPPALLSSVVPFFKHLRYQCLKILKLIETFRAPKKGPETNTENVDTALWERRARRRGRRAVVCCGRNSRALGRGPQSRGGTAGLSAGGPRCCGTQRSQRSRSRSASRETEEQSPCPPVGSVQLPRDAAAHRALLGPEGGCRTRRRHCPGLCRRPSRAAVCARRRLPVFVHPSAALL